MWILLVAPVVIIGVISLIGMLGQAPPLIGAEPDGLRTVVTWRDPPLVAADIAGDPHEQLRQLAGELAEKRFILACSLDRPRDTPKHQAIARIDVREERLELHARRHGGGAWLLWVAERGGAPTDSDDLRQLLSGLYRVLEDRKVEGARWFRREGFTRKDDRGAPTPFYVD